MTQTSDIIIVGAGHGGAQAAISLRQLGFTGSITVIGDEAELPYERPPLSKDYLAGSKSFDRLLIRPESFWAERRINLRLGHRVTEVHPADHVLVTGNGERHRYAKLIWAAGGRARPLTCTGQDLTGIHSVRKRADVDLMIEELRNVDRICVVGGGYIGLETAAVLIAQGKQVILLEAQNRLLARVAGEVISQFYEAEHRAFGVDLRLQTSVTCILGTNGRVTAVRLMDGQEIGCDLVVVGIGIMPAVEPLLEAGADGTNGVLVDDRCRTTLPDVYALGDCALHANPHAGGALIRLESVQNATDMGTTVSKDILGFSVSYNAVPWFWSHQYDLKLQTVGLSAGHDDAIVRGDPTSRSFSVVYLRKNQVVALDCVNAVRDYVQGKALLHRTIDPVALARSATPLIALASDARASPHLNRD